MHKGCRAGDEPGTREALESASRPAAGPAGDNAPMTSACNIAAALPRLAAEAPDRVAMRCPGRDGRYGVSLTYGELDARSDAIAAGLAQRGIVRGTRTVISPAPVLITT